MKLFRNISIIAFSLFAFSCEKHEIIYDADPISDVAEFQLHYVVPVTAVASNNIYQVEINDQLYANNSAPLYTYNAIPSGSVGRFYTTRGGENNIKLYMGLNEDQKLVYNQNCNLKKGKQNIFVYDFAEPPIIFDNGHPYQTNITEYTDSTAWIKFYNFLYEKESEPTNLKLQYQYQYTMNYETGKKSDWLNIGKPVGFGETTGWQPVIVKKSVELSSGYARLDYRIKVIDANGKDVGNLQILSGNKYVDYSDYWNAYVGRRYHHILAGLRTASPTSSVRQFTAL